MATPDVSSRTILVVDSASAGSTRAVDRARWTTAGSTAAASVERGTPRHAKHGKISLPVEGKTRFMNDGQVAGNRSIRDGFNRGSGLCVRCRRRHIRDRIILGGEVADKFGNRIANPGHAGLIQRAALGVDLGQLQTFQRHLVKIGRQRFFFQEFFGLSRRLGRIAGQHPLIEHLRRRERGPVTENHIEEFKALDMSSEHDEADGQWRRQHQSNRSP